jgi:hypothetical protein
MDPEGFSAPFGPTTAEQRHPRFMFAYNHECLWNGPSWPFATSQTLTGMANLICNDRQSPVDARDYLRILKTYAHSHYRVRADGQRVNWLDENLHPYSGVWLSRGILEDGGWRADKGGRERGKDYNHSTFCDLIISGLVGFKPRGAAGFDVQPLVPLADWAYFCLDDLDYRGRKVAIAYDRDGTRYERGQGLHVFVDGQPVAGQGTYYPLTGA